MLFILYIITVGLYFTLTFIVKYDFLELMYHLISNNLHIDNYE